MNRTIRALTTALSLGITVYALTGAVAPSPVQAAAAVRTENKALADSINGAQQDAKAGRYGEALAKAKVADGIQGKSADLTRAVHQMIVSYAISAKDYASALQMVDRMIAANEGNRTELLGQGFAISLQSNNQAKAQAYAEQMGNNRTPQIRLVIASGYAKAKKYKEAIEEVQPLLGAGQPREDLLLFLQATYNEMNDAAKRRDALEQLVLYYGKPQYWHDLLQLARNEKGLNDEQRLDIYRLRLAVGDLKTYGDYSEMAQQALVAGYPGEAKMVLDKAAAAKLLAGEQAARLVKMTGDRVTADQANIANLEKQAAADANAGVKLGLVQWTYGRNAEAEAAVRAAMAKGKLADADAAKVALGHALLSGGKKAEAVTAFNSVPRTSKEGNIARLWSIYARRG